MDIVSQCGWVKYDIDARELILIRNFIKVSGIGVTDTEYAPPAQCLKTRSEDWPSEIPITTHNAGVKARYNFQLDLTPEIHATVKP